MPPGDAASAEARKGGVACYLKGEGRGGLSVIRPGVRLDVGRRAKRQSGRRPVGARGRFSQQFIEDMRASWERHGAMVMDRVAVEYSDRYLGIAAHLIPKEVTAAIEAGSGVLDLECMAILQAIKDSVPCANDRSPQEVLEFVRDAVRDSASHVEKPDLL
jgi:hypothetical protein